MNLIQSTLAALALAALIAPSIAEEAKDGAAKPKPQHDPAKAFKKKDADNDGFLSKEEFTKGAKDAAKAETAFGKRDKDGDGKISLEEFTPKPKGKGKGKKQN